MKRPTLVNFLSILTEDFLSIRASITLTTRPKALSDSPPSPIQAIKLLKGEAFAIKIIGLDQDRKEIFKKIYESDSFGNFLLKIPINESRKNIRVLQIYEVKKRDGLDLHLGSFLPIKIKSLSKIVISDFDKTLVDTRYSTTKELYKSLTSPIEVFPTIKESVELMLNFIAEGHHPFILSASPHFYEDAIRDWLYKREIFTAGIFLKDYREVFSLFQGQLTPKDLKIQGLYKLNHLLDILLMTGLPNELVLMGDNFESDPVIYSALSLLLQEKTPAWSLWKKMKQNEKFQLTKRQNAQVLNKIYQIESSIENIKAQNGGQYNPKVQIYIRKKANEPSPNLPGIFYPGDSIVHLYDGKTSLSPA
ncbi:MAG: phosphatase domain-containing protein [Bacteriovoracaceae bacterium]